jgi:hypothetical protein
VLKRSLIACIAPISFVSLVATAAQAQDASTQPTIPRPNPASNADGSVSISVPPFQQSTDGVVERARPSYDPLGVRMGDFMLRPSLDVGTEYNSNVFNTPTDTKSDWALEVASTLRLISDFPRHALNFLIAARSLFYNHYSTENTTDLTLQADSRIDIDRRTNVVIGGSFDILHEMRGAADLPANAKSPTQYWAGNEQVTFNHSFNRLELATGASFQRFSYDSTSLIGGGSLDNADRAHDIVSVFGQAGYEFSPGYAAFVRGSYNDRYYDLQHDALGYARDSHGEEIDGGLRFEVTRLLVGQVYGGYLIQDYKDARFSTVRGAAYGAQLEWLPSQLDTIRLNASRGVQETTIPGASSYTNSHIGLGIDHELLRNVILSADGMYDRDEYNDLTRADDIWSIGASAIYLMNRNMQFNLGYVFSRRTSNAGVLQYDNNVFRIGIVGKL